MVELLAALEQVDAQLIFTMPNADAGGRVIFKLINEFVAANGERALACSLGQPQSRISFVSRRSREIFVGLIEAPAYGVGTINGNQAKWPFKGEQCNRLCSREMRSKELLPLC